MYLEVSFIAVIRVIHSWVKAAKETMYMYLMEGRGAGVGDKKNEKEGWEKEGVLYYSMCHSCFASKGVMFICTEWAVSC